MSLTHTSFILSHNRPYAYTFKTGQRWLCPRSEIGARDHMSYLLTVCRVRTNTFVLVNE